MSQAGWFTRLIFSVLWFGHLPGSTLVQSWWKKTVLQLRCSKSREVWRGDRAGTSVEGKQKAPCLVWPTNAAQLKPQGTEAQWPQPRAASSASSALPLCRSQNQQKTTRSHHWALCRLGERSSRSQCQHKERGGKRRGRKGWNWKPREKRPTLDLKCRAISLD